MKLRKFGVSIIMTTGRSYCLRVCSTETFGKLEILSNLGCCNHNGPSAIWKC